MKTVFIKSAAAYKDYPPAIKCEIALAGRSNAGKSSFLNALASQEVAKTSTMPGKTTLLNFFEVGEKYRIVDMPGYGYSARSGEEQMSWRNLVEDYLEHRRVLVGVILVMDIRREWEQDEIMLSQWLTKLGVPLALVLTKADKLTKNELVKAEQRIKKSSKQPVIFITSSLKRTGLEDIEDFMFNEWVKPNLDLPKEVAESF